MSKAYLEKVRGIFPSTSKPATLYNYQLVMNLKGPNFIEPSFANIRRQPGSKVEGLVHELSSNELDRIVASEGESYELINAPINLDGTEVLVHTLRSTEELHEDLPASRRYMKILIKAAIDNELSEDYIETLKRKKSVYYPILSELFAIRVYLWVRKRSKKQ